MRYPLVLVLALLLAASEAAAHFNMLLPDRSSVKKGEKVTFTYTWGHPFEHDFFDAPRPAKLTMYAPDGTTRDLLPLLEKIAVPGAEGKKVEAYRFTVELSQIGDATFVLHTAAIPIDDEEVIEDVVRTVVHVQAQKAWDVDTKADPQIVPLTRPYGLRQGMLFQGRLHAGKQSDGAEVEIERYNAAPPKELPADELITFKTKTDPSGTFSFVFPEAGWWSLTAQVEAGTTKHKGVDVPLRRRATLWVEATK
jgi:cobalt/nickel transport protein